MKVYPDDGTPSVADQIPIPVKLYISISEVSELLGVSAATLRYWERCYPRMRPTNFGLVKRRRYSIGELLRIVIVHRLITDVGMTVHSAIDLAERLDLKRLGSEIKRDRLQVLTRARVCRWILDGLSARLLRADADGRIHVGAAMVEDSAVIATNRWHKVAA